MIEHRWGAVIATCAVLFVTISACGGRLDQGDTSGELSDTSGQPSLEALQNELSAISDHHASGSPDMASHAGSWDSVESLVVSSEFIIVGTTVVYSGTVQSGLPTPLPTTGVSDLGVDMVVPIARYGVSVSEVLRNDVSTMFPVTTAQSLEMRLLSAEPAVDQSTLPPTIGQEYLIFASADENGVYPQMAFSTISNSTRGLVHADDPDGPVVWAGGIPVAWANGMTYSEFKSAVITEIAAQ